MGSALSGSAGHILRGNTLASVLVIDDDRTVRRIVTLLFEARGWTVRQAEDGDKGLISQASEPADVVITDIEMPGTSGLDVIATLRRWGLSVPVVAVSGAPAGESLDMLKLARESGANATLAKPFAPSDLYSIVDGLVQVDKMTNHLPDAPRLEPPTRAVSD